MTEEQLNKFNAAQSSTLVRQKHDQTGSNDDSDILHTVEVPKLEKGN
jgi:hypothetical protein